MGKSQRYASVYSVGKSDFANSDTDRYQYAVYLVLRLHYMAQLLASVTASTVIISHANSLTLTHDWPKEKANEESHIQIPVTLAYTLITIVILLSLTIVAIVIKQCFTHIINFYTHYYNRNAVYIDILL